MAPVGVASGSDPAGKRAVDEGRAAKLAALDSSRQEARRLRERLGDDPAVEGLAGDESADLDARLDASRADASVLRKRMYLSSDEAAVQTGDDRDGDEETSASTVGVFGALSPDEAEAERLIAAGGSFDAPGGMQSPREGTGDDLTRINGIGKATEGRLNRYGIWHHEQLAGWGPREMAWADTELNLNGRVVSDRWVPQAQALAGGGGYDLLSRDADGDTGDDGAEVDVPEGLSPAEAEAEKILAEGGTIQPPRNRLDKPRPDRVPDDLSRIKGIGPKIQGDLNARGIYYFDQIAEFSGADLAWADTELGFRGRAVRDRWIPQAKGLSERGGVDLSDAEIEAQRLLASGEVAPKPANTLDGPIVGRAPDDLSVIKGIGPKIQDQLNEEGIYYYSQIAEFTGSDLAWADATLGFRGRVVRDRWVAQAKDLAAGGVEKKADTGTGEAGGRGARLNVLADAGRELGSLDETLSGDEAEAMRLIDSGEFVADESNRPSGLLSSPTDGDKDDLKQIKGVGPKLEGLLNSLGIFYFRQIGEFSATDIAWIDSKLRFRGRIVRDRWVDQAKRLA